MKFSAVASSILLLAFSADAFTPSSLLRLVSRSVSRNDGSSGGRNVIGGYTGVCRHLHMEAEASEGTKVFIHI
jgi:hypothetical protein